MSRQRFNTRIIVIDLFHQEIIVILICLVRIKICRNQMYPTIDILNIRFITKHPKQNTYGLSDYLRVCTEQSESAVSASFLIRDQGHPPPPQCRNHNNIRTMDVADSDKRHGPSSASSEVSKNIFSIFL